MTIRAYAAMAPKGRLEPFEYDPGALPPGEVEVKVEHCGICHTDLAMVDDEWGFSAYPVVPGHEAVGTISAVGAGVTGRKVGDRVGIGACRGSCGRCEWCRRSLETLCGEVQATIMGHHGGWADRVRAQANFAVPIPEGVDPASAGPLMCAGSTVFTPMIRHGVTATTRAAVVGIGGLGHLAVRFLAAMGCDVTAISSTRDKEPLARQLGATRFLATEEPDALKKAADSFDFILSTVSVDVPWGSYVDALRPQGRLVIVGIPETDVRFPAFPLLREKSVCGGAVGSPLDTARMLDFAARHRIAPMVEDFAMRDVNAAVDRVRSGRARFRVVLHA